MNSINHSADDFRNEYSNIADAIKYIKSRQWTITYYLLLLYPAFIGFFKLMHPGPGPGLGLASNLCNIKIVLSILSIGTSALGMCYQINFQNRLCEYRKRRYKIFKHMSKDFVNFMKDENSETNCSWLKKFWPFKYFYVSDCSWWKEFLPFTLVFIFMQWLGTGFVLFYFFYIS